MGRICYYAKEGDRFGHLTVLSSEKVPHSWGRQGYQCQCDCGKRIVVEGHILVKGQQKSCGCLKSQLVSESKKTHGLSHTKCDEWFNDFKSFYNWAISNGYEEGLSIERIDVNGNYSPQNCKWIPRSEQPKNRRCCHFIDVDGEIHTAAEWSRITGLSAETILLRIEKGMSPKAAIEKRATSPKNRKRDEKGRYI